jgi:sarcosine oxidase/L-pipecolate oxidase
MSDPVLIQARRLSVPKTKYTEDKAVNLPKKALVYIKEVVGELFPELAVGLH